MPHSHGRVGENHGSSTKLTARTHSQPPPQSALLAKALERFRAELRGSGKDVDQNPASIEELLAQNQDLQRSVRGQKLSGPLGRVEPILSHINNFAAVIALYSGADPKAAGLVWGSLKVILDLSKSTDNGFNSILDMLDELSLSLPRFRTYEETLPMNKQLESALVDVYTEMICFYARTIKFFRGNPHGIVSLLLDQIPLSAIDLEVQAY